jgi:rubredoxin
VINPEYTCPECGSDNIEYIEGFDFFECRDCLYVWYEPDDADVQTVMHGTKCINPIPEIYSTPLETPLNWRMEQSGHLATAITTFWNCKVNAGAFPTEYQIFLIKCYLEHYINAPCWQDDRKSNLQKLRLMVSMISTFEDVNTWLKSAMEICLDPLG